LPRPVEVPVGTAEKGPDDREREDEENDEEEDEVLPLPRSVEQTPAAGAGGRAGQNVRSPRRIVGRMTPPRKAPLIVKEPIFTVVSVTISWSQRKYHGAFAGLGVIIGLAGSSRGDGMKQARMLTTANVPRTTIEIRRTRSFTELTVRSAASSVTARIAGAWPRATPRSEYVFVFAGGASVLSASSVQRSAFARPPSLRMRHMWYARSAPSPAGRKMTCRT
jgi:hypothetical protein